MDGEKKSWLRRRVEGGIREGLTRTYETVKVDPGRFLMQLRAAHGLPLATFHGVYTLPVESLDDVADSVIRAGMKLAAAEGAGFGLGGLRAHMVASFYTFSTAISVAETFPFEILIFVSIVNEIGSSPPIIPSISKVRAFSDNHLTEVISHQRLLDGSLN